MLVSHLPPTTPATHRSPTPEDPSRPAPAPQARVLAVGYPGPRLDWLVHVLRSTGHRVGHAEPGAAAPVIEQATPEAVVALDEQPLGPDVIHEVRSTSVGRTLPLVMVTPQQQPAEVAELLRRGADDCVPDQAAPLELGARIAARLRRVAMPVDELPLDPRTGLHSPLHFRDELDRELHRPAQGRRPGVVAMVGVAEMRALESRLGTHLRREVAERLAAVAMELGAHCDRLGWDEDGHLLMLMPATQEEEARGILEKFAHTVGGTRFVVADENVRLTPVVGWLPLAECAGQRQALDRARVAVEQALSLQDLRPVRYESWMRGTGPRRNRLGVAVRALLSALSPLVVLALGVGVPLAVYLQLGQLGIPLGSYMYWVVVGGLLLSAVLIVLECMYALDAPSRPEKPGSPYPPASAVIAAYLPNEAATIVDTVESFLRLDYPGQLEIVLAYNTPHPLPVEDTLREMAARDRRLVLLPVDGSTSKAQNVNAAVSGVRGEFVGIFDADHHPRPDAFRRAWDWLSNGYDVVQGHCLVRNGGSSWVARMVAVEFEAIYAVSHPGRTRLYGFGVFGGSNGFWRTDLLARTRMHGSMLTEDIDSTLRALRHGARFTVDRTLISRELAPTGLRALWNQRSRWAQGWLQVSVKHLWRTLRSPVFTRRQKLGLLVLLGWREAQPWLTLQILPVILYAIWASGGVTQMDWAVPLCLLAALFTLSAGVIQAIFAWRLAAPEIRRRRSWFWAYLLTSTVFYTHFKNILARQACLKEALGERQWRVTPRAAAQRSPVPETTGSLPGQRGGRPGGTGAGE
ncbi:glycosyltransferase [Streptomyces sp. NPDC005438]|uniref:glycosyltransferase n=1 Tax=Streptomyces sp. NPDC005438 TaxID=3156880 RepID=UPI0033BED1E3